MPGPRLCKIYLQINFQLEGLSYSEQLLFGLIFFEIEVVYLE